MDGEQQLKNLVEAALLAAGEPLSLERLAALFPEGQAPESDAIRAALQALAQDCEGRGIELREVASGYRLQVRPEWAPWISRLSEERPARYSRALMETLALIAYRQPITRAEIEDIRGVSVSTNIIKTLQEREWVRVVGHRDVPGKPALYATTRQFLDYFNLKSLDELPPLADIRDIEEINAELELKLPSLGMAKEAQAEQDDEEEMRVPEAASAAPAAEAELSVSGPAAEEADGDGQDVREGAVADGSDTPPGAER